MTSYGKIEGKRKGSIVYVHDNFTYTLHKEIKGEVKVRCVHYRKYLCKASGYINKATDLFTAKDDHNHTSEESEIQMMKFKSELKDTVESSSDTIVNIFREVAKRYSTHVVSQCPLKSLRSMLYKRRKKNISINNTAEEEGDRGNKCSVCLGAREETWALKPCFHAFCASCSEEVINTCRICPLCRAQTSERLKIFLN